MTIEVDTIVARATGAGPGAIAVVRVSGPRAFECLATLLPEQETLPRPRVATLVTLRDPVSGEPIDQGLATCFEGPDSYTGEDVVEFSGHGGSVAPGLVLEAFLGAGCREAEPGEFTRRAWANGRIDLVQAEAIDDLIHGRSLAAHRTAMRHLDRGLSSRVSAQREELVGLEALLVHHLDFPEEDDAPTDVTVIATRADALADGLESLAGTASEGLLLRRGAVAVLAGAPNAGKSSLFNALVGEDRALVTEIEGTTRDAIECEVSLGGFPFRIVDTAGLRPTDERLERLGIEVAERRLSEANVVLLCVSREPEEAVGIRESRASSLVRTVQEFTRAPVVIVWTKSDLIDERRDEHESWVAGESSVAGHLAASAITGAGLPELRALLPGLVFAGLVHASDDVPVLTRRRQLDGVLQASGEIREFADALRNGIPPEIASAHLKSATTALEGMLGVISSEDVLDRLFSSFCIGK